MSYIIATNRNWRSELSENISRRTGAKCVKIKRKEELSAPSLDIIKPETIFLPFWSHYIPPEIFEAYECIVFHMTDLPFGRGGTPLQNLIVRGVEETKISALRCTAELDAGPIYLKRPLSLIGSAQEIYMRASQAIEDMIVTLIENKLEPLPQQGDIVEFKRRVPEDGDISALSDLQKVYDFIRMLDAEGYPSAFLETKDFKFEFSRASLRRDHIVADVKIKVKKDV